MRGFESWLVRYGFVVEFDLLEQVILNSVYSDANGNEYPVLFSFQDAMGHRTKEVYDFCRVRDGICAARGVDQMAQKVRVSNIDTYAPTNQYPVVSNCTI